MGAIEEKSMKDQKKTPQKKPHLQYRFEKVKRELTQMFRFKHHKQSPSEVQFETDCAYLVNHIEKYGFNWFPSHYVKDDIINLERMVRSFNK